MEDHRKLYRLHDLSGYKVASHYADVRGWKVVDADNRTVGKVDDLLVNKAEERVVYLDVEADHELTSVTHEAYNTSPQATSENFNKEDENHFLIPVGAVTIHTDDKIVVCNTIGYDSFRMAKRFKKGHEIDRDYEIRSFHNYFPDEEQYGSHDEDNFYNRRQFNKRD